MPAGAQVAGAAEGVAGEVAGGGGGAGGVRGRSRKAFAVIEHIEKGMENKT